MKFIFCLFVLINSFNKFNFLNLINNNNNYNSNNYNKTRSESYIFNLNETNFIDENDVKIINNLFESKYQLVSKLVVCTIFLIICFVCLFGNILVVLSVFTYRPLQSVQNIYIVSLALADTFVAVFVMPFHISYHITDGKWIFSRIVCHFFLFLDILLCTSSILHLCCIALDRYWAIKDSIKYAQKRTMKRVLVTILIAWISSALISLPVIIWNLNSARTKQLENQEKISTNNNNNNSNQIFNIEQDIECDIPHDKLYRFYSSAGTFYVPLFIMTFVYVRIFLETKRRLHERAKAAKKLAKSMANSSFITKNNKKKSQNKCFICILSSKKNNRKTHENEIEFLKTNTNHTSETLGAKNALNIKNKDDEFLNTEKAKLEDRNSLFKMNMESDDSSQTDQINKQSNQTNRLKSIPSSPKIENEANSDNLINNNNSEEKKIKKVSIGTNTVNETKRNLNMNKTQLETIVTHSSDIKNRALNTSSTWTRANPGISLKQRQKISLTRERKAARTLGIIMGAFTVCWLPFFIIYLLQSFDIYIEPRLFEFLTWLGYVNSALNPIIYTIFNLDFRKSFERILFDCILCKRRNF